MHGRKSSKAHTKEHTRELLCRLTCTVAAAAASAPPPPSSLGARPRKTVSACFVTLWFSRSVRKSEIHTAHRAGTPCQGSSHPSRLDPRTPPSPHLRLHHTARPASTLQCHDVGVSGQRVVPPVAHVGGEAHDCGPLTRGPLHRCLPVSAPPTPRLEASCFHAWRSRIRQGQPRLVACAPSCQPPVHSAPVGGRRQGNRRLGRSFILAEASYSSHMADRCGTRTNTSWIQTIHPHSHHNQTSLETCWCRPGGPSSILPCTEEREIQTRPRRSIRFASSCPR